MIVPMKRVTIAMLERDVSRGLTRLGAMGVVHLEPVGDPRSPDTDETTRRISLLDRALSHLPSGPAEEEAGPSRDGLEIAREVVSLAESEKDLHERIDGARLNARALEPLGDFAPRDLEFLEEQGLTVRLYECRARDLKTTPVPVPHAVVGSQGRRQYLLCVDREDFDVPFRQIELPAQGLGELRERIRSLDRDLARTKRRMERLGSFRGELERTRATMVELRTFQEAAAGMGVEGPVAFLRGVLSGP